MDSVYAEDRAGVGLIVVGIEQSLHKNGLKSNNMTTNAQNKKPHLIVCRHGVKSKPDWGRLAPDVLVIGRPSVE